MQPASAFLSHASKRVLAVVLATAVFSVASSLAIVRLANSVNNVRIGFLLGAAVITLGLYPFIRAFARRNLDLFEPIYPIVVYFVWLMGVRGLYILNNGSYFILPLFDERSSYFDSLMSQVFIYAAIALITLYVGYYGGFGVRFSRALPRWTQGMWRSRRVILVFLVYFGLGSVAVVILVQQLGGLTRVLYDPGWNAVFGQVGKFYIGALTWLSPLAFYILFIWLINRQHHFISISFALFFLYGVSVIPLFLIAGGKTVIFESLIILLICYHYLRRKMRPALVILVFIMLVPLTPLLELYRYWGANPELIWDEFSSILADPFQLIFPVIRRSYGADSFAIILHRTPSEVGWQWGRSLLDLFYWFIPRALWPAKPFGYGWIFGLTYMSHVSLSGAAFMSPSLIGELYLNFSWIGIIIGFWTYGVLLRTTFLYLIKQNMSQGAVLLYAIILAKLLFLLEGPIAGHLEMTMIAALPALLAVRLLSRANR